jgi:hypothetical protein
MKNIGSRYEPGRGHIAYYQDGIEYHEIEIEPLVAELIWRAIDQGRQEVQQEIKKALDILR